MHELTIAENIKKTIEEVLKDKKAVVTRINLRVGKLRAVVPEALIFCFKFIAEGSSMENAELKIQEIPVKGICKKCDRDFVIDEPLFICPFCGSNHVELLSGRELEIESIEIEEG